MAPKHRYVQHAMLGYAMISGDAELATTLSQRLDRMDPYPTGLNDYNYDTLASVAENGILITFGDTDTYPAWVLQQAQGVRPDVLVVNYYLLGHKGEYAKWVFGEAGLSEQPAGEATARLAQLRTSDRPLHLAATVGDRVDSLAVSKEDLYTVGLTFRVSDSPVENLGVTRRLYGEVWRLDELRRPLSQSPQHRVGLELSPNYLVPLIELLKQDRVEGRPEDPALRVLVDDIARRNELTVRVASLLGDTVGKTPRLASKTPGVGDQELLSWFNGGFSRKKNTNKRPVAEVAGYLMQRTEVSNAQYNTFLADLLRQRKFDYLDSARVGEADWRSFLPSSLQSLPDVDLYKTGKPEDDAHPVVNISHRAAELYAIWLTQIHRAYHPDDPKIRFRLPSAEEHAIATAAGKRGAVYSWGGPAFHNASNCRLANARTFYVAEPPSSTDHGSHRDFADCDYTASYFTAPVDSYYPNNFGLYNMTGNAAEMTDEDGITVGGSWLDDIDDLKIGVVKQRQLPSPTTGFRLIMEYVD